MPAGLACGTGVSVGITLLASAILAKLLDSETLAWENIGYCIMVMLMGASFLGALTARRKVKRQILLSCMAAGGIYFCVLLSMTALFFGGQYQGVGVTGLLVLAGCGSAALMGISGQKGRGERKRRIRHR